MHNWEYFIFFVLVLIESLLPINKNGFDSTSRLSFEHKRFIGLSIIFDIRGDFVNVFLLSWEELFLFVILKSAFAGTKIKGDFTQCSWCIFRKDFFCHEGQFSRFYLQVSVRNCFLCWNFTFYFELISIRILL